MNSETLQSSFAELARQVKIQHSVLQKVHLVCDVIEIDDAETANERVQFLADKLSAWKSTCDQITGKEGHEASPLILTTYVNELKQQLSTCQRDKERLDWLETNSDRFKLECDLAQSEPFWISTWNGHDVGCLSHGINLRQTLDAAIASNQINKRTKL